MGDRKTGGYVCSTLSGVVVFLELMVFGGRLNIRGELGPGSVIS